MDISFNKFLSKVFSTLGIGLGITAAISILLSSNMDIILLNAGGSFATISIIACILELVVAIFFGFKLYKMSKGTAWFCYIFYSILTGISLSSILYAYTATSVAITFLAACLMFGCLAFIGHTTKTDLTRFSGLIIPALLAVIIVSLLNLFFFRSNIVQQIVNYAGILIFLFLIAYDMQTLRTLYSNGANDAQLSEKMMIYGAFGLYLDFINIFIRLLEIFGKRDN